MRVLRPAIVDAGAPASPARRRGERGAALLVAVVAVAVLTALALDVAYETRVSLEIAANARDELRASWLARSGVALSRFVLGVQQTIDDTSAAACGAAGALTGAARGPLTQRGQNMMSVQPAAAGASSVSCPRPQIWSAVPISSGLVQALFGGAGAPPGGGAAATAARDGAAREAPAGEGGAGPKARFGDFDGAFDAKIEDEGRKTSAQLDGLETGTLGAQVLALYQLVCDPRWDRLFDREDANGNRVNRQDWIVHLRDWVDEDQVSSTLAASFPGAACAMVLAAKPFEQGFGDENQAYDRGEDRYKAKNARLDSLDELHLVAGVSDPLMAAFGDRLTVYLPKDAPRNVNTIDAKELVALAALVADPPGQPMLADPALPDKLRRAISDVTIGGLLTITPAQFASIVQALGITVNTLALNPTSPKQFLTDRSYVYRIRSAGMAGAVTKTIDAVVSYDPQQNRDAQSTALQQAQAGVSGPQAVQAAQAAQAAGLQAGGALSTLAAQGLAARAGGTEKPSRLLHWTEE
jgi:general secretion pathway protein K